MHKQVRLSAMRTGVAAALAMLLAGCSGGEPPIKPKSEIDMGAWRQELITRFDAIPNIDMDRLYELTAEDCDTSADEIGMRLAIAIDRGGPSPDFYRVNLRRVCPGREHVIDDELLKMQETDKKIREACRAPARLRTAEQQTWAELEGC